MTQVNPALIGKAGELLVAAELMRRGVEVAHPASDVGVDLLAYRLEKGQKVAGNFVPIQVKARSGAGYSFFKRWFANAPGLVLVHVWFTSETPEFYIFESLSRVEDALGSHADTPSWKDQGAYVVTSVKQTMTDGHYKLMQDHRNAWDRIINQLGQT